jgi:hypothetical protein
MAPAIVGLAVLASVTGLFVFMGAFLLLASDSCGAHQCNDALVNWAVYIAALGPIVVFVAALVTTLVLLFTKHRAAAVVPWVSLALLVACLLTGYVMMKVATGA